MTPARRLTAKVNGGGEPNGLGLGVTLACTLADKPVPARRWIVPGWIPRQQVTLLSGDGGTGKSLTALQLMVAVDTGARWLGLDVERVSSFGLFAEDDDAELHIRLAAVARAAGVKIVDLQSLACVRPLSILARWSNSMTVAYPRRPLLPLAREDRLRNR